MFYTTQVNTANKITCFKFNHNNIQATNTVKGNVPNCLNYGLYVKSHNYEFKFNFNNALSSTNQEYHVDKSKATKIHTALTHQH